MLDYLFETSWEVCNRVGGIYAVLSTKAKTLQRQYKDRVIFIGPDLWTGGDESPFFVAAKTPLDAWQQNEELPLGVKVRLGRWNVPGKPIAILVDYRSVYAVKDALYAQMWEHYGVDSLHGYGDYDESCMFACGAALVIESIVGYMGGNASRVVAHFDEWTTGMGLLHVKSHLPHVATVFTTHATSIGRSICGNGKPLYDYMAGYDGDQMAMELNMQSKHSLEKAAAHAADVFTTVSEVTARECEQLLGRRPMVTPNAFERGFVPKGKAYALTRDKARSRLLALAKAMTGVTYDDDTMLVATSGRCEFRNKGIDAYLDALNVLRAALKDGHASRRVVAFVLVPSWTVGPRADVAANMASNSSAGVPCPQATHVMHEGFEDAVIRKMRDLNFGNVAGDLLHVFYVPCYLNGADGIIDMTYYDVLCGLDLTVFPSYYEPWGYTPLESVAFGVPTITTDLAGFGQWVLDTFGTERASSGVHVLHRDDSNYHETVHALAQSMAAFYGHDANRVAALVRRARATAAQADWQHFMHYYDVAYEVALNAVAGRMN